MNVRYLSGYTGSNGLVVIDASEPPAHCFFTDFRYATQSAEQVPDGFKREIDAAELLEAAARALGSGGVPGARMLGFDEGSLTVKQHTRLGELLASGWELRTCAGVVSA